MLVKRSHCIHSPTCICTRGHLSETALLLVFRSINWNPKVLCVIACVCKWFEDLAKRLLWKEFCKSRAPKMVSDLLDGSGHDSIEGNWNALGKLMIYCAGCHNINSALDIKSIPGHLVYRTRFSKTSGKSFLWPQCRSDTLYISDPCEHLDQALDYDIGLFRGVFRAFGKSKIKKSLIQRHVGFHPNQLCPYCKNKVWSMLQAKMIPKKAHKRLGAFEDQVEYFVCLNGHVIGVSALYPLSSESEHASDEDYLEESDNACRLQGCKTDGDTATFK
eukprot:TRINITY_DN3082_c0_g1_i10.p1 TRINITY_DN3082_c0_g1~~TRINITY_DN3082_c0_g1_i10.p1  ORF type:complete len:275 (+),score=32.52 TRINITY_DN3082_c0_g1_i10:529-1353(+)